MAPADEADEADAPDAPEASRPDVASVDVDARIDGLVLSDGSLPLPFRSSPPLQQQIKNHSLISSKFKFKSQFKIQNSNKKIGIKNWNQEIGIKNWD